MIEDVLDYLCQPLLLYTLLGVVLSTSSTAIIGNFWLLQKKSLIGDVIAHALLPGICLGFLCTGGSNHVAYLTIGGIITGALALFFLDQVHIHTTIKKDTAIAMTLSIFLGIGLFLLTYIQQSESESQAGLSVFLFGHTATLLTEDIFIFVALACIVTILTLVFFKAFTVMSFDPIFTQTIGWPLEGLRLLLQVLTILTIVAGVRAMGTLLIASILIIPAATARFWSNRLSHMVVFSACLAALSSIVGTCLSFFMADLPTGPSIVLCMIGMALVSFFLAPQHGFFPRRYRRYQYQEKVIKENVLKLLYELGGEQGNHAKPQGLSILLDKGSMSRWRLKRILNRLVAEGLVRGTRGSKEDCWGLTPAGEAKGRHMLILHTLWEAYLMNYLAIEPDHVHDDAEAVEHLLTPEIEADLRKLLGNKLS